MSSVAVTSASGSPGATALALGLALAAQEFSSNRPLLVEADPSGGALALRFGLPSHPSLASLASEISRKPHHDLVARHSNELRGVSVVSAPTDPLVASWALSRGGAAIGRSVAAHDGVSVVDIGRLSAESPALSLAEQLDLTVVATRSELEHVQASLFALRVLRSAGIACALVVIGDEAHSPREIAGVAGVPLAGVIPDDPLMACGLIGGTVRQRRFRRSLLWQSIQALAELLLVPRPGATHSRTTSPSPPPQSTLPPPQGPATKSLPAPNQRTRTSVGAAEQPRPRRPGQS